MNKRITRPAQRTRVSLQDKVAHLLKNDAKSHQATFIFEDGSCVVRELTDAFLKGKRPAMIIADLKAIQHDMCAKYFSI